MKKQPAVLLCLFSVLLACCAVLYGEFFYARAVRHCVVLSGMESGLFQVADPIYGENSIDPDVLWDCFESMGQRAILVELD